MPKISIIIPIFNTQNYLEKCLNSAAGQTLTDIEIICINDSSIDNSLKILEKFAKSDKRIKIINLKKNLGSSCARNIGIIKAKGKFLSFLDSDDYFENDDFLEILYSKAIKTNSEIVKGNYKNSNGTIDKTINEKIALDKNNFCSTFCSAIFKTSLIKENEIKFPKANNLEDPVFTFKAALKANKIEIVENLNIIITERKDSLSAKAATLAIVKEKIENLKIIADLSTGIKSCYPIAYWFVTVFLDSIKSYNSNIEEYLIYNLYPIYKSFKDKNGFKEILKSISSETETYFSKLKDEEIYYFDKEKLKEEIDKSEVVSFDIFDTLLLRPFLKPTDTFSFIEQKFKIENFAFERVTAEKRARIVKKFRNKGEDVTFDKIYETIKPEYRNFKQIELDCEKQTLQANKEMLEIFNYAKRKNKKIIIVSDMYLASRFLSKTLKEKGFSGFLKLYVSSEINKTKASSNLFKFVIRDLKVEAKNILHIGDNFIADFQNARKQGLNSFYYKMVKKRYLTAFSSFRTIDFYKSEKGRFLKGVFAAQLILNWFNNRFKSKTSYWQKLGYDFGGILIFAFVCEIRKIAEQRELTDLFFIARDGFLIKKVYDFFFKNGAKTHYIYASRKLESLCSSNNNLFNKETFKEYENYCASVKLKGDKIGIVDSCAGAFSAQKLIESFFKGKSFVGIYISSFLNYKFNYINLTQLRHINKDIGFNWDFVEFLTGSNEAPIENLKNLKPLYRNNLTDNDKFYLEIFPELKRGVLEFASDIKNNFNETIEFCPIRSVFYYFEHFWNNFNSIDIKMLAKISHPKDTEQVNYTPLIKL